MDRPTMLHIIYCMVSAQQVDLSEYKDQKNLPYLWKPRGDSLGCQLEFGNACRESVLNSVPQSKNRSRTRSLDQRIKVGNPVNRSVFAESLNTETVDGPYNSTRLSHGITCVPNAA